jgi:hypothetical protein
LLIRVKGTHAIEDRPTLGVFRGAPIDQLQALERRSLPITGAATDESRKLITGSKPEPVDQLSTHEDVFFGRDIARLFTPDKSGAAGENLQHTETSIVAHGLSGRMEAKGRILAVCARARPTPEPWGVQGGSQKNYGSVLLSPAPIDNELIRGDPTTS